MITQFDTQRCKDLEAYETPRWAIKAVLEVEVITRDVFDPCVGTGAIPDVVAVQERQHVISGCDIYPWGGTQWLSGGFCLTDFLDERFKPFLEDSTVIMNPPFSKACEFVTKAMDLNARKIICFQRQAWRESRLRREWWDNCRPARVWVCGARANCWRFDLLDCQHVGGKEECASFKRKAKKREPGQPECQHCMGGVPTSHAWYVWERGHTSCEITNTIWPEG